MKSTASHLTAFALGVLVGALAVAKGCPPISPVPADQTPPPVSTQPIPVPSAATTK